MSQRLRYTAQISLRSMLCLFAFGTASAHASAELQHKAEPLSSLGSLSLTLEEPSQIQRGRGINAGQKDCYLTQVPSSGILMLEIGVSALSQAEPKLEIFNLAHHEPSRTSFRYQERFAAKQAVLIPEAGWVWTCVSAQDPEQVLASYKLAAAFRGRLPSTEEDPDEHEPDALNVSNAQKTDEDPDEHEPDAQPLVATPDRVLDRSCHARKADDHSDTFRCASAIATSASIIAELRNDWADDQDLFLLTVETLTTITVEATGYPDLVGALYDRAGNRLSVGRSPASDQNGFYLAKTLSPGSYYLQVESRYGSQGAYQLRLKDVDRQD